MSAVALTIGPGVTIKPGVTVKVPVQKYSLSWSSSGQRRASRSHRTTHYNKQRSSC